MSLAIVRPAALVLALMVSAVACAPQPSVEAQPSVVGPSQLANGSSIKTHDDILVIVGYQNHVAITQPLVEVFPPAADNPAVVHIAFAAAEDRPVMLGIEGAIGFVSAHAPDGSVVLYQIVELEGDTLELPAGDYVLLVHYRSCDGSCGFLDPPQDFCEIEHSFAAGTEYDITVTIEASDAADCAIEESPSA